MTDLFAPLDDLWPSFGPCKPGPGSLTLLSAGRNLGKTWLCVKLATLLARKDCRVLLATLGMPSKHILTRAHKMSDGSPPGELFIADFDVVSTVPDLMVFVRRYDPHVVIVDGVYLLGRKSSENLHQRTAKNLDDLRIRALSDGTTVIAVTQSRSRLPHHGVASSLHSQYADTTIEMTEHPYDRELRRIHVTGREHQSVEFTIKFDLKHMQFFENISPLKRLAREAE